MFTRNVGPSGAGPARRDPPGHNLCSAFSISPATFAEATESRGSSARRSKRSCGSSPFTGSLGPPKAGNREPTTHSCRCRRRTARRSARAGAPKWAIGEYRIRLAAIFSRSSGLDAAEESNQHGDEIIEAASADLRQETGEQRVPARRDVFAQFRRRQSPGLLGPRFNACHRDAGEYVLRQRNCWYATLSEALRASV
jgi:hypothetical protein